MKKIALFIAVFLVTMGFNTPVKALSPEFIARGLEHCTSGKKGLLRKYVEGNCDQPTKESCTFGGYSWCKKNCGHKLDMDKMCKLGSDITIVNTDTKAVDYRVVGSDGTNDYQLKVGPKGTVEPKKTVSGLKVVKGFRAKATIPSFRVIGVSQGVSPIEQACNSLEFGKNYTITFTGKTVGIKCSATQAR